VLGSLAGVEFTYGDLITIDCVDWYQMDSGCKNWLCDENGEWSPTTAAEEGDGVPVCSPKCGLKNGESDKAVLEVHLANSPEADANEWPWTVFINFGAEPVLQANTYLCMGFLISPHYVATAAHCLFYPLHDPTTERDPSNVFVWLGAHDRTWAGSQQHVQQVNVAEVIPHPDYVLPRDAEGTEKAKWDNDYGLLRLSEPISMNDYIRPICVPESANELSLFVEGDDSTPEGIVAGWGYTTSTGQPSYVLREAKLPSITNDDCTQALSELYTAKGRPVPPNFRITENMFCAGYKFGRSAATCSGDSGSAYMVPDDSNKYFAVGIVSYGVGVCTTDSYSVFAKVTEESASWIRESTDLSK